MFNRKSNPIEEAIVQLQAHLNKLNDAVFPDYGKKNELTNNVYPLAKKVDSLLIRMDWLEKDQQEEIRRMHERLEKYEDTVNKLTKVQ